MDDPNTPLMICRICGHPVTIATCTADENGKAVHEECYGREIVTRFDRSLIFPPRNENDEMASLALANLFIPFLL